MRSHRQTDRGELDESIRALSDVVDRVVHCGWYCPGALVYSAVPDYRPNGIHQGNLSLALLIRLMIIPMLLKFDFGALHQVKEHWRVLVSGCSSTGQ